MAEVLHLTFDTDLSEFDDTETDGGDLSASAAAAMVGAKGLQVVIDDTTSIYGNKDLTKAAKYRARFYLDINSLTMSTGDDFYCNRLVQAGGSYYGMYYFYIDKQAGNYRILVLANDDANSYPGVDTATLTDAPHYIEVYLIRATTTSSNDGSLQWWIDGVSQGTITGLDNYNLMDTYNWFTTLGALGINAGTSGTLYLDDYIANDDGAEIGPAASGAKPDKRPLGLNKGIGKRVTITL